MKVRELIAELIQYDMDEDVFIGLGESKIPIDQSAVHSLRDYTNTLPLSSNGKCPYGVYIIPLGALFDKDAV
jgi:hypothetical protein